MRALPPSVRLLARLLLAFTFFGAVYATAAQQTPPKPLVDQPVRVVDGVWFQRSYDTPSYGSNVAWIEFADFIVVVDAAHPLGAEQARKGIRAAGNRKPIRYVVVTHYHGDHSFGAGVFAQEGAIVVAHENARRDLVARGLPEYARRAQKDALYARHPAVVPQLTFTDQFIIDDGRGRRAEIHHFGHAHTSGDVFVFLPKEKVLFTGDACVNGPFNAMADGDSQSWVQVLGRAQALGPAHVVPGHGPLGTGELLETQRQYFVELRAQVGSLIAAGKSIEEVQRTVDIPRWKAWTGKQEMNPANIAHIYQELTRGPAFSADGTSPAAAPPAIAVTMAAATERPHLKYLTGPLPPAEVAGCKQLAPNVELVVARTPAEALALAADVDGMSGAFATTPVLKAARKLRWIQQGSAGVDHLLQVPALVDDDRIVLTSMKRMYGPNIADHAFALLLGLTRGLPHYLELQKTAAWERGDRAPALYELKDKTLVLIGLGGIGVEVARRAHGFGMHVLAVDPKPLTVPAFVERLETPAALEQLLPLADVVVVAAPLTPKTNGLFGAAQIARLKPSAYFINVARGKIQDNQALAAALTAGKLAGAGLDVTDPEPLPPTHPLWKAPNVLITPHIANRSPGAEARRRALFLENMRRFAAGEPLLNVVDKRAGY